VNRSLNFGSLLVIAFCVIFPHYGGGIFVYPWIVLLIVFLFLKFTTHENFSNLFFSFHRFAWSAIWVGLSAALALFLFFEFAWHPLINILLGDGKIDLSAFAGIRGHPARFAVVLLLAFFVGGFYEELIFHGFIFTRLEKILPGKKSTVTGFCFTAILFGLYHYQQGVKGILLSTLAGAVYHLLILKFNRNLWYGIFVHTFFDVIGLTMIYLGYL
jgi:membrane protease YdiL (CAAX protease family)